MTMLKKQLSIKRKFFIGLMKGLMYLSAGLTAALVLFLVSYVLIKGIPGITWQLLSREPSYLSDTIGILPDILNTVYIILATLLFVLPLGVGAAIPVFQPLAPDCCSIIPKIGEIALVSVRFLLHFLSRSEASSLS